MNHPGARFKRSPGLFISNTFLDLHKNLKICLRTYGLHKPAFPFKGIGPVQHISLPVGFERGNLRTRAQGAGLFSELWCV